MKIICRIDTCYSFLIIARPNNLKSDLVLWNVIFEANQPMPVTQNIYNSPYWTFALSYILRTGLTFIIYFLHKQFILSGTFIKENTRCLSTVLIVKRGTRRIWESPGGIVQSVTFYCFSFCLSPSLTHTLLLYLHATSFLSKYPLHFFCTWAVFIWFIFLPCAMSNVNRKSALENLLLQESKTIEEKTSQKEDWEICKQIHINRKRNVLQKSYERQAELNSIESNYICSKKRCK